MLMLCLKHLICYILLVTHFLEQSLRLFLHLLDSVVGGFYLRRTNDDGMIEIPMKVHIANRSSIKISLGTFIAINQL